MTIDDSSKKREQNTQDNLTLADFMPERKSKTENEEGDAIAQQDDNNSSTVNLQKRNYDLDATRYGDWELNGRCVDF